jgi:alkanesulfonate monooxygenase SsuD/methylene tetrahydromethanopterin reductase-like flavin-dependent oxidoreductase (luciferase family)
MRFGLFGGARTVMDGTASDSQMYTDYIDYVQEAERLGFESLFLVEHHFTGMGQLSASLSFLCYLAAKTTRMRLGTAVVVLPWHNPVLLVEQAATLDLVSNGRFDFGVGRGYRHVEFHGFGIPLEEAEERYQEALAFIRKAWSSRGRFSHHGKYWNFADVVVEPAPVQRPHPPFWVGVGSDTSIEGAAREGFNILLAQHGSPAEVGHRIEVYRRALEAHGRAYRPHSIGLTRALHVVRNAAERDEAHELRHKFLKGVRDLAHDKSAGAANSKFLKAYSSADEVRRDTEIEALIGDPDEIVARIREYEAVGVDTMLLMDVSGSMAALRTFGEEVMPRINASVTSLRAAAGRG